MGGVLYEYKPKSERVLDRTTESNRYAHTTSGADRK